MKRHLILLIVCCFLLTGCSTKSIKEKFDNITQSIEQKKDMSKAESVIKQLNSGSWSQDTADLGADFVDKFSEYSKSLSWSKDDFKQGPIKSFWSGVTGKGFTAESRMNKAKEKISKDFESSYNKITVSMDFDKATMEKVNKQRKSGDVPWLLVILVGVVAIIFIVKALLKRKKKPKVGATKVNETKAVKAPTKNVELKQIPVNEERVAKRLCEKRGVNYETELARCNGDVQQLINELLIMET